MDWQDQLITVYLYVCKHYEKNLWVYCQRMSNHADLSFSDQEVIALYLFGIIDKKWEIKQIYNYADRHLRCWFPKLPSYVAFVQRLNRISEVFAPLLEIIQEEQEKSRVGDTQSLLIDSFPVALAKQGHRFKACVAPNWLITIIARQKSSIFTVCAYMLSDEGRRERCPRRNISG